MLWPSQHSRAERAGPFPCSKNTELQRSDSATQHLCHPSCRHHSRFMWWKTTRAGLDHAVHKGNENFFSLYCKEGLFTPKKMRSGSPFLTLHTYKPIFLVIKSQSSSYSVYLWAAVKNESKQMWSSLHGCTCTSSMPNMHILLYYPSSCCNLHTSLEILRSALHAATWNSM